MTKDHHIIPFLGREHHIETRDCPCEPYVMQDDCGETLIVHEIIQGDDNAARPV